ncbi:MAG: ATP-binding protein [Thermodesulfovibrionia bacterium]|nr:ATP-binding protein [Thermodesulfovibrionia bacterium]
MFINRKKELEALGAAYKDNKAQFIVIYGKRRVGKTELVKQFFKNIPHIYFLADKAPEKEQLRLLSEKVGILYKDEFLLSRGFGNWYEFFKYIKDKGRVVLAIDEFPFLIEANKAVPSIFQKGWDESLKDSGIFLILLGSSIGMMETDVLGYKSPLFGRRTGQLLIEPLGFRDSRKFFPKMSDENFMYVYSILGGTPAYLLQFDPSADLWTNIRKKILMPDAYLFSEPEFILKEELREPRNYFSILRAISMGKTRVSEIINETGFEKNVVGKYLSVLTDLRIVKREVPVTEKAYEKSKKGIYMLDDNYFRFWFKYVFPNKSFVEEEDIDYVIRNKIRPELDIFVSQTYEDVCRSYVRKGFLKGMKFNRVGRWWIKDAEIDVIGINEDDNAILFGEVKWSEKPVGVNILNELKAKAEKVQWGNSKTSKHFVLFSRKGFTNDMLKMAEKEKIVLLKGVERVG